MRRTNRRVLGIRALLFVAALATLPGALLAQERPVLLDPPEARVGDQSVRIAGWDPAAPRQLVLWRFESGAYRRIASRRSAAGDGRFDFGQQSWPIGPHRFHVAPAGMAPERSRSVSLPRSLPSPRILSSGTRPTEIQIVPALAEGVILVRDAESGRLLMRSVVTRDPATRLFLDLAAEGVAAQTDRVTLEHVLDDGRRSPAIRWSLREQP